MKVEKKITKHGHDREAELEYYREAQVCPDCGNSAPQKIPVNTVLTGEGLAEMQYFCLKCGCGAEAKQTDGAAEEKFTLFPQLQKDDIVRYVSRLSGVEIIDVATYEHLDDYFYFIGEVVAIYRFDGKGFGGIWQDEEAMERYAKEAEGEKHDPKKKN